MSPVRGPRTPTQEGKQLTSPGSDAVARLKTAGVNTLTFIHHNLKPHFPTGQYLPLTVLTYGTSDPLLYRLVRFSCQASLSILSQNQRSLQRLGQFSSSAGFLEFKPPRILSPDPQLPSQQMLATFKGTIFHLQRPLSSG